MLQTYGTISTLCHFTLFQPTFNHSKFLRPYRGGCLYVLVQRLFVHMSYLVYHEWLFE